MISVADLTKSYRVHERPAGLKAALRSLFHREYKTLHAVRDLSFEIGTGQRVGLLGPNGAGKTTTLKLLSGLLHPSSGEARVLGFRPRERKSEFLRSITLVTGQKQQLLWDLPPQETFDLNRAIYDVPRAQYRTTLDELLTLLELGDLVRKPTRQLSLGERMKCELAAALIHRPRLLFLDEPTIGLDVNMQAVVRAFICAYNERHQATVILTSHYMDDVVAITPRVLVVDHGHLTYDGALTDLARQMRPEKRVSLRFAASVQRADLDALGSRVLTHDAHGTTLLAQTDHVNALVTRAVANFPLIDLKVEDAPIEEVLGALFARSGGVA